MGAQNYCLEATAATCSSFPEIQGAGDLRTFTTEAFNLENLFNGIVKD